LLCQAIFTENAKRFNAEKVPYLIYVFILVLAMTLVSVGTYLIYEYILKPNMNDKLELSLMYEQEPEQNFEEPPPSTEGGGGQRRDIDFLKLFIYAIAFAACFIVLYIVYRIMKYAVWLLKTKKSANNELIRRIYVYILDSLNLYGIKKGLGETPYEYFALCSKIDLPVSETEMEFLTEVFVETYYGERKAADNERKRCIEFLDSVSASFRNSLGMRRYLFEYLLKKKVAI
jgi:hypothetical protein